MASRGATLPTTQPKIPTQGLDSPERTQVMRKGMFALAAVGLLAVGSVAACGDDNSGSSGSASSGGGSTPGKVGIILPDTKSSQRWGTDDPKFLKEAFAAAGVQADIQNAQGD